jgi:hypothetical protein
MGIIAFTAYPGDEIGVLLLLGLLKIKAFTMVFLFLFVK